MVNALVKKVILKIPQENANYVTVIVKIVTVILRMNAHILDVI